MAGRNAAASSKGAPEEVHQRRSWTRATSSCSSTRCTHAHRRGIGRGLHRRGRHPEAAAVAAARSGHRATTIDEYRKHLEKDSALERRFQPITVGEPNEEQALRIMEGLRDRYEAHHRVHFTDEALQAAVTLADRYIQDRFLPDKAIDVLDEAGAHMRIRNMTLPKELRDLDEDLRKLRAEKDAAPSPPGLQARRPAARRGGPAQRPSAPGRRTGENAEDHPAGDGGGHRRRGCP